MTRRYWEQQQAEAAAFTYDYDVQGVLAELGSERQEGYLERRFSSLVTSVEASYPRSAGARAHRCGPSLLSLPSPGHQVGLENFEGKQGAARLAASLSARYTSTAQKRALAQLLSMIAPPEQPIEARGHARVRLSRWGSGECSWPWPARSRRLLPWWERRTTQRWSASALTTLAAVTARRRPK